MAGPVIDEREREAKPVAPAPAPVAAGPAATVAELQRTAGNQATARALEAGAVASSPSSMPTPESAAAEIGRRLRAGQPNVGEIDRILTTLQLMHSSMGDVQASYERAYQLPLMRDLQLRLPGREFLRAKLIVEHGRLRLADKLYLAVCGDGTDEETLFRLVAQVGSDPTVEADFASDYGKHYGSGDRKLPNGSSRDSAIVRMLEDELEDWELDKGKALYAFGILRPVDEIRIATNRSGTDEAKLYKALEDGMKEAVGATPEERKAHLAAAFALAYPGEEKLDDLIDDELSFGELDRAELILEGRGTEGSITLAMSGLGTDEDAIFEAIAEAAPGEREVLLARFTVGEELAKQKRDPATDGDPKALAFYERFAEDLDDADLARLKAVLRKNKADGAMELLAQAGADRPNDETRFWGSRSGDLVDAIRDAGDEELAIYRSALEGDAAFRKRVAELDEEQQRQVRVMLTGSLKERMELAMGTWDHVRAGTDEDYIFKVLQAASAAERQAIARDEDLLTHMRRWEIGTADYNRVLDLLRTPESESVEERVAGTHAQIDREYSSWTAGMSADWALRDEARDMDVRLRLAKRDGSLTTAEQSSILNAESATRAALETYKLARDEVEEIAAQVITTAAGVIVTLVTFGAGAVAVTAINLAKAAAAAALTKVLATKLARGDRFDILGTDGAAAFATGALDGVTGVLAAAPAGKLTDKLLGAANSAITEAAESTFRQVGRRLVNAALEGGMSAAPGALFETTVQATEMRGRIEDKLGQVGLGTVTAIGTSALTATAMEGLKVGGGAAWDRMTDIDGPASTSGTQAGSDRILKPLVNPRARVDGPEPPTVADALPVKEKPEGKAKEQTPVAAEREARVQELAQRQAEVEAAIDGRIEHAKAELAEARAEKNALRKQADALERELEARARARFGPKAVGPKGRDDAEWNRMLKDDPSFRPDYDRYQALNAEADSILTAPLGKKLGALFELKSEEKLKRLTEVYDRLRERSSRHPRVAKKRQEHSRANEDELGVKPKEGDTMEVEHYHPLEDIVLMDGFVELPLPVQEEIAHMNENLGYLFKSRNSARGSKPYTDWNALPMDPKLQLEFAEKLKALADKQAEAIRRITDAIAKAVSRAR